MDQKFTRQYEKEDEIVSAIMSATNSDELAHLQAANRYFLTRNSSIHELLVNMSYKLRESSAAGTAEGWEG